MESHHENSLISVIIPTLNEQQCLAETLDSVRKQAPPFEIIISDGGSTDGTYDILQPSDRLVTGLRGRASQMNAGAQVAAGDILVFLHADTSLPVEALAHIRAIFKDPETIAGCFDLEIDAQNGWSKLYASVSRIRWKRILFGDRAFFVRREVFERLSGFRVIPIFEDLEFALRVHSLGKWHYLTDRVVTSGRRFQRKGWFVQQLLNLTLWTLFHAGVNPRRLKKFYPDSHR